MKLVGNGVVQIDGGFRGIRDAEEFPLVLECRLVHALALGTHTQFIGEIVDVKGDRETLGEDGLPDILRLRPLVFDTAHQGYHAVGPLLDRALAKVCEVCPVCLHARYHQKGMVFDFVKKIEGDICPFCTAYERVHGKKAHERRK